MRNYRPAWHRMAKCGQPGADPHDYDTSTTARGFDHSLQIVRGVEACEGCPVMRSCAQWALDEQASGVVAAGVSLPWAAWWRESYTGHVRQALARIVAGEDMMQVVRDEMCRSTTETSARRLIEDRIVAKARGAVLPRVTREMITGGAHV